MKIYTLGYSGWTHEAIQEVLDRIDGVLIDIRMVPRSRCLRWDGSTFARKYGDRYVKVKQFGNVNYKGTMAQVRILDFAAGVEIVRELTKTGRAPILLCGCPDVNQCHRKILAARLAEAWGAEVEHITRPGKHDLPGQTNLF